MRFCTVSVLVDRRVCFKQPWQRGASYSWDLLEDEGLRRPRVEQAGLPTTIRVFCVLVESFALSSRCPSDTSQALSYDFEFCKICRGLCQQRSEKYSYSLMFRLQSQRMLPKPHSNHKAPYVTCFGSSYLLLPCASNISCAQIQCQCRS